MAVLRALAAVCHLCLRWQRVFGKWYMTQHMSAALQWPVL